MEDLTSILPRTADLMDLNCSFDEEADLSLPTELLSCTGPGLFSWICSLGEQNFVGEPIPALMTRSL